MTNEHPRFVSVILDAPAIAVAARVAMALPFALSAVIKAAYWPGSVAEAAGLGMAWPATVAAATIATQLIGSILLLSRRWAWLGAGMLGVFTAIATIVAHAFWEVTGAARGHELATFTEHIAIIGGFVLAAILIDGDRLAQ